MRLLLRIFAVLDLISIVSMVAQIWSFTSHFNELPDDQLSHLKAGFTVVVFFSLFASAIGLFLIKKYGIIIYYLQFPFRLFLFILSIGFITFLPELFNQGDRWFAILFRICVVAEFFRVYYTILAQRSLFRKA